MMQSSMKTRAMWASVAISASTNRLCWNLPIGLPNAVALLGVVERLVEDQLARAAAAETAIESRSWDRFVIR